MKRMIPLFVFMVSTSALADCRYERTETGEYVYVCTNDDTRPDPNDGQKECWWSYDPETGQNVLVCE